MNMGVVKVFLGVLCFAEFSSKFVLDDLETISEICSCRYHRHISKAWLESWMETKVCKVRCLFCRSVWCVVECKFGKGKIIDPVILLVRGVGTQVDFEGLVRSLCEAVCLWVVGS